MFAEVWRGYDGIYGGYVLARVVEETRIVEGFSPLSVSIQFMGSVRDIESEWEVDLLHRGSSSAAVSVGLRQGHLRLTALGKLGAETTERIIDHPVDLSHLPAPESLQQHRFKHAEMKYQSFLDHRLIPASKEQRQVQTEAWVRFDESTYEAPELGHFGICAILLDAQPPGLFFASRSPVFVPTIDFTIHFAPGVIPDRHAWYYIQQRTVWATAEFCVEESRLHDNQGAFVAQVRQTRRVVW